MTGKDRLNERINKRITTTMIGCISQMEEAFSFLWGNTKDYQQMDENQQGWYNIWRKTREKMLDFGNKQIRGFLNEIDDYDVVFRGYSYNMPIKRRKI